jgi:hypothetical protein
VTGAANIAGLARQHHLSRQALLQHSMQLPATLVQAHAGGAPDRVSRVLAKLAHLDVLVAGFIAAAQAKGDFRGADARVANRSRPCSQGDFSCRIGHAPRTALLALVANWSRAHAWGRKHGCRTVIEHICYLIGILPGVAVRARNFSL